MTDNAANLVFALKDEPHLRCICHSINLVVTHGIDSCEKLLHCLEDCRKLVTHFKRCELQQHLTSSLKQDVDTRCNSVYEMVQSILQVENEVMAVLVDRKEDYYIEDIDFILLNNICTILASFKMASEFLSSDQEPNLHLVLPFVKLFNDVCEFKDYDSPVIKGFKKALKEKVNDKIWLSEFHYVATFLHPETKSLSVCYILSQ